jgi:hypothetical protein
MMQPSTAKHFTPFFSAAEEAAAAAVDAWSNEGGHMHANRGHIVQTRSADQPYKVVFDHEDGPATEQACATIREGEAIIRRNTPVPPPRRTFRDQEAGAL